MSCWALKRSRMYMRYNVWCWVCCGIACCVVFQHLYLLKGFWWNINHSGLQIDMSLWVMIYVWVLFAIHSGQKIHLVKYIFIHSKVSIQCTFDTKCTTMCDKYWAVIHQSISYGLGNHAYLHYYIMWGTRHISLQ